MSPAKRVTGPDAVNQADRETRELVACQLLRVPHMTPRRAARLIEYCGVHDVLDSLASPTESIRVLMEAPVDSYRPKVGGAVDRGARDYDALKSFGATIWLPGDRQWEEVFDHDRWPPIALFAKGDLAMLNRPRVGIVGTRSATPGGRELALRFGRDLAELGIAVVSGLAFGIDASAHAGSLAAVPPTPIGVVGTGLDVPYPSQNLRLWKRVAVEGLMLSEYPLGTRPTQNNFPERNRIIAALSQVLVIVESTVSGGSLLTVRDAWERARPVLSVPGSPLNNAAAGTNQLLRKRGVGEQEAMPCLDTADILTMLSFDHAVRTPQLDFRRPPEGVAARVLAELGWEPATTATLIARVRITPMAMAIALGELEEGGWVRRSDGLWNQIPAGSKTGQ